MIGERWFSCSDDDWNTLVERLPRIACPHCKRVGNLIRHGSLTGFDDASPPRKTLRARRLFCSNRYRRTGCGRTVAVWIAHKIRRFGLTTRTLLDFLRRLVVGTIADAVRDTPTHLSDRTLRRCGSRFTLAMSRIRTALCAFCPPPTGPPATARRPVFAEVLDHLRNAFPDADDPLAAYQQATGTFVL